jgi:hypothetical protein
MKLNERLRMHLLDQLRDALETGQKPPRPFKIGARQQNRFQLGAQVTRSQSSMSALLQVMQVLCRTFSNSVIPVPSLSCTSPVFANHAFAGQDRAFLLFMTLAMLHSVSQYISR